MGELRERRRFALPLAAGVGGMAVPVLIFLAINAGRPSAHGWGAAMSTDTALALGMLALVGPRFPERLRAFMLTVSVVDDVDRAAGDRHRLHAARRALAAAGVAAHCSRRCSSRTRLSVPHGLLHVALGGGLWFALYKAGVDPVVSGSAVGLLTYASPAARVDLERATDLFKLFREQPTPELARSARIGLTSAISPNERLQQVFHPWTSYAIVPLFALANAGVADQRRCALAGVHLADHAGHSRRVRARQAGRHRRCLVARHEGERRPAAATGRLGRSGGWRLHRRHRLHGVVAHLESRVSRNATGRRKGRRTERRAGRVERNVAAVPEHGAAAAAHPDPGACRNCRRACRSGCAHRQRA